MDFNDNLITLLQFFTGVLLLILNGFFVAVEFALVKARPSKIKKSKSRINYLASAADWALHRMDESLSVCQLGITVASLGLGWIGELAVSNILISLFNNFDISVSDWIHSLSLMIAFSMITTIHVILGEQVPKIFAIARPELVLIWCAVPFKLFYFPAYPVMVVLKSATNFILQPLGVTSRESREQPHSEEEIRALLGIAHARGELSRNEHQLLNAVFEFDDMICRQIMVPRVDISFFNLNHTYNDCLKLVKQTKHTRFPLCRDSLDEIIGVVHVKDLLGISSEGTFDLTKLSRPPQRVPDTMPVSKLLKHFQNSHQHLAFVVDEYGTTVGVVTLENVVEQIFGAVEDEFDSESPDIIPISPKSYIIKGFIAIERLNAELRLNLQTDEVDTLSGLLMERVGRILKVGDKVQIDNVMVEVLEMRRTRAIKIRLNILDDSQILNSSSSSDDEKEKV